MFCLYSAVAVKLSVNDFISVGAQECHWKYTLWEFTILGYIFYLDLISIIIIVSNNIKNSRHDRE